MSDWAPLQGTVSKTSLDSDAQKQDPAAGKAMDGKTDSPGGPLQGSAQDQGPMPAGTDFSQEDPPGSSKKKCGPSFTPGVPTSGKPGGGSPGGKPLQGNAQESPSKTPGPTGKPKTLAPRKTPTIKPVAGNTPDDSKLVGDQIGKVPTPIVNRLIENGYSWLVPPNNVTNAFPETKGKRPRNWPPDLKWEQVPGQLNPVTKQVVVATVTQGMGNQHVIPPYGRGHGSRNLALHETGHAVGRLPSGGKNSPPLYLSPDFKQVVKDAKADAANAGAKPFEKYFMEKDGGIDEMFAEGFALTHDGSPAAQNELLKPGWRKIGDYFKNLDDMATLSLK
jgi:hypothetical protein